MKLTETQKSARWVLAWLALVAVATWFTIAALVWAHIKEFV
jgi:hypothetical protein